MIDSKFGLTLTFMLLVVHGFKCIMEAMQTERRLRRIYGKNLRLIDEEIKRRERNK
jgi:hypothetical protein